MHPIPCAHCGNNYMRPTNDPEAPKLCNNCTVREEKRSPKGETKMHNIGILIQCPQDVHKEIEELCINQGIDLPRYFLDLHYQKRQVMTAMQESMENRKHFETNPSKSAVFVEKEYNSEVKIKGKKK